MLSTSSRGSIGELKVCIDLMKKGWTVFQPIVDDISCDLIAIKDNIIKTIQVKSHSTSHNKSKTSITIDLRSKNRKKKKNTVNEFKNFQKVACGNIDIIAVLMKIKKFKINTVIYIPTKEIKDLKCVAIAFTEALSGQKRKRREYQNYLNVPI